MIKWMQIAMFAIVLCGCVEVSNTYRKYDAEVKIVETRDYLMPVAAECGYGEFPFVSGREDVQMSRGKLEEWMMDRGFCLDGSSRIKVVLTQHGFSRRQSLEKWVGIWLLTGTIMTRNEAAYPISVKVYDSISRKIIFEKKFDNQGVIWVAHLPIIGSVPEIFSYYSPSSDYFKSWIVESLDLAYCAVKKYVAEHPECISSIGESNKGDTKGRFFGTGWFVNTNHIVTCAHVIKDVDTFWFNDKNGERQFLRKIAVDNDNDIALLQCKNFASPVFLPLGTNRVNVSDKVFSVGYPLPDLLGEEQKYAEGVVSSEKGLMDGSNLYQVSVPLQPGNSGGAVIDENGFVIGIVSTALSSQWLLKHAGVVPQNVNFAVKSGYIKLLLDNVGIRYSTDESSLPAVDVARQSTVMIVAE